MCRLLSVIQTFDPPGVGARNLQECLLIQLRYLSEEEQNSPSEKIRAIAEQIVCDQFEHIVARRYSKLARAAGCSVEETKQALEYIRTRLNPAPANQFRPPWKYRPNNNKATVRPEIIIRRTEFGYEVEVLSVDTFALSITPAYRTAYNQIKSGATHHTEEDKKHILEYVERAELFIRNLNLRRQSLRQITKCVIDHQVGFLETGSRQFLRPLTRTQIARTLGIHELTVSRATANKFVQLPNQEVVNFGVFFNASLSTKDAIEDIINSEDPSNPYSDQQIVEQLSTRGISVARRTIVKYREARKILSSSHRRR